MTADTIANHGNEPKDETHARDVRDDWTWVASHQDRVKHLSALADERDLDLMEEKGIAAVVGHFARRMLNA